MGLDPFQLVLLLAVALAPPVILAVRLRNAEQRRREPWRVLWRAFVWGAVIAATLAILFEGYLDRHFGQARILATTLSVTVVLVAPFVEELVKALGLRIIDDRDPEPEDGYIYGGAVGLGFAATENVIYILTAYVVAGESTAFATALYRGVATVALHGAASAIAGHGVWRARYGGGMGWAVWGLSAAIALHVAYNALTGLSQGWAALGAAAIAVLAYMRIMRRVRVLDERG